MPFFFLKRKLFRETFNSDKSEQQGLLYNGLERQWYRHFLSRHMRFVFEYS